MRGELLYRQSFSPAAICSGRLESGTRSPAPLSNDVRRGTRHSPTLAQQLNTTRKATSDYKAATDALNDGYRAIPPHVPQMGFHFGKGAPFGTDIENPPVLAYQANGSYNPDPGESFNPDRADDLRLGAVEFIVPGEADPIPDIFADETASRSLKVSEEHGWHYHTHEDFTALHAWVHRQNPAGVFYRTNPTVD